MNYSKIPSLIVEICASGLNFEKKVMKLQKNIGEWDVKKLAHHLENVGAIPEMYEHDSAEEKLYAKYCDILICAFFELYGMESKLFTERGDFPDVFGSYREQYTIVADAKAFRLSRTALNPKDYKIAALNQWRRNERANYACLVAPLHEFPKGRSRLFNEAVSNNVALLSYAHLLFILSADNWKSIDLRPMWDVATLFSGERDVNADMWWQRLDALIQSSVKSNFDLKQLKRIYLENITKQAQQQIEYWQKEKQSVQNLSKEELVRELINSMGIEQKIAQIKRKVSKFPQLQDLSSFF